MNIYSKPGTKIRFDHENAGYPGDGERAKKYIKVGEIYTVEKIDIGQSCSRVILKEVPNVEFNTVLFSNTDNFANKPCFVCNSPLKRAFNDDKELPYAGTIFISYGHYGSTVYDPLPTGDSYLEIFICDICLIERKERVEKVERRTEQKEISREIWPYPHRVEKLKEY